MNINFFRFSCLMTCLKFLCFLSAREIFFLNILRAQSGSCHGSFHFGSGSLNRRRDEKLGSVAWPEGTAGKILPLDNFYWHLHSTVYHSCAYWQILWLLSTSSYSHQDAFQYTVWQLHLKKGLNSKINQSPFQVKKLKKAQIFKYYGKTNILCFLHVCHQEYCMMCDTVCL